MNGHIEMFEGFVGVSETDSSEAYNYFFLVLPDEYKSYMKIVFEGFQPADIHQTCKRIRTLIIADKWENQKRALIGQRRKIEIQKTRTPAEITTRKIGRIPFLVSLN